MLRKPDKAQSGYGLITVQLPDKIQTGCITCTSDTDWLQHMTRCVQSCGSTTFDTNLHSINRVASVTNVLFHAFLTGTSPCLGPIWLHIIMDFFLTRAFHSY